MADAPIKQSGGWDRFMQYAKDADIVLKIIVSLIAISLGCSAYLEYQNRRAKILEFYVEGVSEQATGVYNIAPGTVTLRWKVTGQAVKLRLNAIPQLLDRSVEHVFSHPLNERSRSFELTAEGPFGYGKDRKTIYLQLLPTASLPTSSRGKIRRPTSHLPSVAPTKEQELSPQQPTVEQLAANSSLSISIVPTDSRDISPVIAPPRCVTQLGNSYSCPPDTYTISADVSKYKSLNAERKIITLQPNQSYAITIQILPDKESIHSILTEAKSKANAGDWDTAIEMAQSVQKVDPLNPEASEFLAKARTELEELARSSFAVGHLRAFRKIAHQAIRLDGTVKLELRHLDLKPATGVDPNGDRFHRIDLNIKTGIVVLSRQGGVEGVACSFPLDEPLRVISATVDIEHPTLGPFLSLLVEKTNSTSTQEIRLWLPESVLHAVWFGKDQVRTTAAANANDKLNAITSLFN